MTRKIIFYCISFLILFVLSFFVHSTLLKTLEIQLRFPIFDLYLFHFIFSLIICCVFLLLSNSSKWSHQLGFIYIFTFITKVLFFAVVFKNSVFNLTSLSKLESFNLLIPLFIFLFLEVYFITKILNTKKDQILS